MINRLNKTVRLIKGWDKETLESLRYALLVIIGVDLFGIIWYLKLKTLGIAIMLVAMIWLVIILSVERRLPDKMCEEKQNKKHEPDDEEPEEDLGIFEGMDLGLGTNESNEESESSLPSAEEYNKRLENALGSGF